MNLKNDKRGGLYFIDTKPYLAVTTVLSVISKPAIQYWFGKQVYLAMVANPTLNEKEAMSAPYQSSDKAKSRGSTVHSIVEAYVHSKTHIESIPEEFRGYAQGFYKWVEQMKVEIQEHEKTVFNPKERYAGTLDLIVKLNGELYVIDAKTGKDIYAESHLQTSAYQNCFDKGMIKGVGTLLLMENGSYKFETHRDTDKFYQAFLAAKTLYEGLNQEDLQKVHYL